MRSSYFFQINSLSRTKKQNLYDQDISKKSRISSEHFQSLLTNSQGLDTFQLHKFEEFNLEVAIIFTVKIQALNRQFKKNILAGDAQVQDYEKHIVPLKKLLITKK